MQTAGGQTVIADKTECGHECDGDCIRLTDEVMVELAEFAFANNVPVGTAAEIIIRKALMDASDAEIAEIIEENRV
jgi:hypothetical protein